MKKESKVIDASSDDPSQMSEEEKAQPTDIVSKELAYELFNEMRIWVKSELNKKNPRRKVLLRKHIPWKELLVNLSEKGNSISEEKARKLFSKVCNQVQVERSLDDILNDVLKGGVEKAYRPPIFTGYMLYSREKLPHIKQKHPKETLIQISRKISKRWSKLEKEQKDEYNKRARDEMIKRGWEPSPTSRKRGVDDKDRITYPASSLRDFYVSTYARDQKPDQENMTYNERRKQASENFGKLTEGELDKIKQQYNKQIKKFLKDVKRNTSHPIESVKYHILTTSKLRSLLKNPMISEFLNVPDSSSISSSVPDSKKLASYNKVKVEKEKSISTDQDSTDSDDSD